MSVMYVMFVMYVMLVILYYICDAAILVLSFIFVFSSNAAICHTICLIQYLLE